MILICIKFFRNFFYFFSRKNIRLCSVLVVMMCWFCFMKFCTHNTTFYWSANICGALDDDDTDEHFKFTFILFFFPLFNIRHTLSKKVNRMRVCWFDTKKLKKIKGEEDVKLSLLSNTLAFKVLFLDGEITGNILKRASS